MKVTAISKYVHTSSRKLGLVAAIVRGRPATEALTLLDFEPKAASELLGKALKSAMANAEANHSLRPAELVVEQVLIGPGPTLKRRRPRARGSAYPIRKRTSHITVTLSTAPTQRTTSTPVTAIAGQQPTASAVMSAQETT